MKTFQIAEAACAIVVGVLLYSADILACSCNTRTGLPDDVPALLAAADLAFAGRVVEVEEYTSDEVETAPLAGITWTVTGTLKNEALTSVPAGSEASIMIADDGTVDSVFTGSPVTLCITPPAVDALCELRYVRPILVTKKIVAAIPVARLRKLAEPAAPNTLPAEPVPKDAPMSAPLPC